LLIRQSGINTIVSIVIQDFSLKNGNAGDYTYRDLNFSRNSNFKSTKIAVNDLFAIRNSLVNLLSIRKGTRILDTAYGNELDEYLFEQISEENAQMLGEDLEETLKQEPRVVVQDININVDKIKGIYNVEIFFAIPTLNERDISLQVDFSRNNGIEAQA
jgi:phage baseplate assembly protein W